MSTTADRKGAPGAAVPEQGKGGQQSHRRRQQEQPGGAALLPGGEEDGGHQRQLNGRSRRPQEGPGVGPLPPEVELVQVEPVLGAVIGHPQPGGGR